MSASKRGLVVTSLMVGFSATLANAQAEQCVSIDSDVARLECFDAAFSSGASSSLTVEEAINNLIEITSISNDWETLDITSLDEPCTIQASWKFIDIPRAPQHNVIISTSDLTKVERIGDWTRDRYSDPAISLYYDRGTEGRWTRYYGVVPPGVAAIDIGREGNLHGMRDLDRYTGRDASFYLMAEGYQTDGVKIMEAMVAAVSACQNQ